MNWLQRLLMAALPREWGEAMRRESREWQARCGCGLARSIWELGGIRWKAAGSPRRLLPCPRCGKNTWHTIVREPGS